jgi:hypothetical protein
MQRDVLVSEVRRLQTTRDALCAVIHGAQGEMRAALDAQQDNPEVFVACAQVERDGRMLEAMKLAMVREIDVAVALAQQLVADADSRADAAYDSDADGDQTLPRYLRKPTAVEELPHELRELAVDPAVSNANAARRAQVADDHLYGTEVVGDEDFRRLCGCGEESDVKFPCGHSACWACTEKMLAEAIEVNGVKQIQCYFCHRPVDEGDFQAMDNRANWMRTDTDMLSMQRLLLKL